MGVVCKKHLLRERTEPIAKIQDEIRDRVVSKVKEGDCKEDGKMAGEVINYGSEVDALDVDGITPLFMASAIGHVGVIKYCWNKVPMWSTSHRDSNSHHYTLP